MRALLRELFAAALTDLDPAPAVRRAIRAHASSFGDGARVTVLALGKAARSMAAAAARELGALSVPFDGLCVPPEPDDAPQPPFVVQAGGHPLPTEGSLRAGARALEFCRHADERAVVLVLLSGGASAMCELPNDPAITLAEVRACYRALVGCGAGIEAINVVRKFASAIKGGRLAAAAERARAVITLAVSDVPGDLRALASGPTVGDTSTIDTCRAVVREFGLEPALPRAFAAALANGTLPPLVAPDDPRLRHCTAEVLLDNRAATAALAARARARDFVVEIVREADELEAGAAADLLLQHLARLQAAHRGRRVAIVAGGEVRVALPPNAGRGGRNQQFALHCAERIQGQPIAMLSCGTDGIDGNSPAAGAVVDGTTVARAAAIGLDVAAAIARCDAHPLLQALGDTVVTGPTGTNVRDVRVIACGP